MKCKEKTEPVCSCSCEIEQLAVELEHLQIQSGEMAEAICSRPCEAKQLTEEAAELKETSKCNVAAVRFLLTEGAAQSACGCSCKVKKLEKDVEELKASNACKEFDVDCWTKETASLVDEMSELKSYLGLATAVNAKATVSSLVRSSTEPRLKAFRKEFEAQAKVSVEKLGKRLEAQNRQQADALSKRLIAQNAEELSKRLDAQDRLLAETLNKLQDAPDSQLENLQKVVDNACQKVYGKCESMENDFDALSDRIDDVVIRYVVLDNRISRLEASEGGWNSGLDQRLTALDKKVDLSVERVTQLFQETKCGPTDSQERSGGDAEFARMVKRLEGKNADLEKKVEALTNIALKVSAG
jgi:hypothetical protein